MSRGRYGYDAWGLRFEAAHRSDDRFQSLSSDKVGGGVKHMENPNQVVILATLPDDLVDKSAAGSNEAPLTGDARSKIENTFSDLGIRDVEFYPSSEWHARSGGSTS